MEFNDQMEEVDKVIAEEAPVEPAAPALDDAVFAKVMNELAKLGASAHVPAQPAPGQKVSNFAVAAKALADEGVSPAAIARYKALNDAIDRDKREESQALAAIQRQEQFNVSVFELAFEAVDEVAAGIPAINKRPALKEELVANMDELVARDKRFADIKAAVAAGQKPSKARMKVVAAEVTDKLAKDLEITVKPGTLDIQSSKPIASESQATNVSDLPKAAQQIHGIVLKATGDPKKAMQRALELARG